MNYTFRYDVIWRNLDHLFFGLWIDVYMAVIAIALGTLIGLVVAFSYFSKNRVIRGLASWYVTIIRNIPLMIVVLFIYFGLPDVGVTFVVTQIGSSYAQVSAITSNTGYNASVDANLKFTSSTLTY